MICPYCNLGIYLELDERSDIFENGDDNPDLGFSVAWELCPQCGKLIIVLVKA